jgi:hypothetical protein
MSLLTRAAALIATRECLWRQGRTFGALRLSHSRSTLTNIARLRRRSHAESIFATCGRADLVGVLSLSVVSTSRKAQEAGDIGTLKGQAQQLDTAGK